LFILKRRNITDSGIGFIYPRRNKLVNQLECDSENRILLFRFRICRTSSSLDDKFIRRYIFYSLFLNISADNRDTVSNSL